jgi:RNA polymerase sigma-70 factor (ECF subfamily)
MEPIGHELLSRLLDEHGARLVLFAQQRCSAPEDVVQEAFVQLMRESPPPGDPAAWLYRVVRNGAISAARSADRRAKREQIAGERRPAWFAHDEGAAIDARSAVAALESLDVELREAVVLRLWSGMSFDEIAQLTDASSSTAHRRYEAGMAELRKRLGAAAGLRRS